MSLAQRISDWTMKHPDELLAATGVFIGAAVGFHYNGPSGVGIGTLFALTILAIVWANAPRETWEGPHE